MPIAYIKMAGVWNMSGLKHCSTVLYGLEQIPVWKIHMYCFFLFTHVLLSTYQVKVHLLLWLN